MKIVKNTSVFDTRALRSLICKTHAHMRKLERRSAPNWAGLRIAIRGKSHGWSGRAYHNGVSHWTTKYSERWGVFFSINERMTTFEFAVAVYHELMHTYGYNHSQYNDISHKEVASFIEVNEPIKRR